MNNNALKQSFNFFLDTVKLFLLLIKVLFTPGKLSNIRREDRPFPIYVMGNGPSLTKIRDIVPNRNSANLCTVNFSIETDLFFELKPEYHTFADGAFFLYENPRIKNIYTNLLKKVSWSLTLIVPSNCYKQVLKHIDNPNISVRYYSCFYWEPQTNLYIPVKHLFYRRNIITPPAQNVCIACIFASINLGYKDIRLLGVEHSWTRQMEVMDDNILYLVDEHYYNKDASHTPFYSSHSDSPVFKVHEALFALSLMFKGYHSLRNYANSRGDVKIFNLTEKSMIDAFDRKIL